MYVEFHNFIGSYFRHLIFVLEQYIYKSDCINILFTSYQIHEEAGGNLIVSSHMVVRFSNEVHFHAITYNKGAYTVTTFIEGRGKVTKVVKNYFTDDINSLRRIYDYKKYSVGGVPEGADFVYIYGSDMSKDFNRFVYNNKGALSVPSQFNLSSKIYYDAIINSLSYMLRAKVSRLRMLGVKKYTGKTLSTGGITKEFSDAQVDILVVNKVNGRYNEISLGFKSKGTHYKLDYLPCTTPKGENPASITVSRFNDRGVEEFSEVNTLNKSYVDVLISFTDYLHEVLELIYGVNSETYSYAINVNSIHNPIIQL